MKFLIYSQSESDSFGSPSFWSNEFGWTSRDEATEFNSDDIQPETMAMPMPDGVVMDVESVDCCGFISVYGRRTAIADGVLIDLGARFPEEAQVFSCPVACTDAVWRAISGGSADRDVKGVVNDMLCGAAVAAKGNSESSVVMFDALVAEPIKTRLVLKMAVGPDDNLAPCLTIMLPAED